jgi:hypothetical protein
MIIESLIKRPTGTQVTLDDTLYDFQPVGDDGAHICKVSNTEHIKKFLAIEEAFVEYANQGKQAKSTVGKRAADTGVVSKTEYDTMTKKELAELIIERGLSNDKVHKLTRKSGKALIGMLMAAD